MVKYKWKIRIIYYEGTIDEVIVRPPNNLFQNLNTTSLAATGFMSTVDFYPDLDEMRVNDSLSSSTFVDMRLSGLTQSILDDLDGVKNLKGMAIVSIAGRILGVTGAIDSRNNLYNAIKNEKGDLGRCSWISYICWLVNY